MPDTKYPLKVFICYAHDDKLKVRELYHHLKKGDVQPWLDAEDLLAGQEWEKEIPKAIASSDAIIICLSKKSVGKESYIQKEIKFALDKALEMPEGHIFLIPVRLEECEVPESFKKYQWVDLFDQDSYSRLMKSLQERASQLGRAIVQANFDKTNEELRKKVLKGDQNNALDKLQRALNSQDSGAVATAVVAIFSLLLQTSPETVDPLDAIIRFIEEKIGKTVLAEISSKSPGLPLSSKRLRYLYDFKVDGTLYSPEKYPFESRFDNISQSANLSEQNEIVQAWSRKLGLKISPFSDAQSPYATVAKSQVDLRDTLTGLFQDQYKPGQNKLVFQNDWDLRAGFYDYCRGLSQEQNTFFVSLAPGIWNGFENATSEEIILHTVAREWLQVLVLDQLSFFELDGISRYALCRLLAWHCGSFLEIRETIDTLYQTYTMMTEKDTDSLFETIGNMLPENVTTDLRPAEINAFLQLRPLRTMRTRVLYSSIELDNQLPLESSAEQVRDLEKIAGWLQTLRVEIDYFVLGHSLRLPEGDLVKLCNNRVVVCSDGAIHGFDELFAPHINEPAETLLARKAHGSPGEMIRLGQKLLLGHCQNHPDEDFLDIQELLDLKA